MQEAVVPFESGKIRRILLRTDRATSPVMPCTTGWHCILRATAVLIVRAVAGMFRAQALLTGQGFNLKAYLRALAGKM